VTLMPKQREDDAETKESETQKLGTSMRVGNVGWASVMLTQLLVPVMLHSCMHYM